MRNYEQTMPQLINNVNNVLVPWQQHGLMQTIIRDIANSSPSVLPLQTVQYPPFIR